MNRVAVVTGAGRGLGEGMARGLVARGWRVALLDRDATLVDALAQDLGPAARAWTVDVTDAAGLATTAAHVIGHFGRVDVLVCNAGIGGGGPLLLSDPLGYERIIEVNLLGSIRTVRAFLPSLIDSRGHLLQIASLAAFTPSPFMSAYCASKSGVEAFAHSLRSELMHHRVTVGVAYLGFTATDMVREADSDPALARLRASLPWPFGATSPVGPAVARLVRGVESRRPHVYAQPWLRVLPLVRGGLPGLGARRSARGVAAAEEELRVRSGPAG